MKPPPVIVAPASAPGRSARAIVRLSGRGTDAVIRCAGGTVPDRRAVVSTRVEMPVAGTAVALPVLLTWMPGPRSYTGEDGAEIQLPGNPDMVGRVIARMVDAATEAGVELRHAEPGEFTARAFMNGRLDLAEAEGVARTIAAQTDAELEAARRLREGALSRVVAQSRDEIASVLALVEVGIDFTDEEDVVAIEAAEAARRIGTVAAELDELMSRGGGLERDVAAPRIVLAGDVNVGKSTLFNALIGRERAIVSACAGTTRDALVEPLRLETAGGHGEVVLVDVAGGERAASAIDVLMQARARQEVDRADLVLRCVLPGTEPPRLDDARSELVVWMQIDRFQRARWPADGLGVSARAGTGMGALRAALVERLWSDAVASAGAAAALMPRHERSVCAARAALRGALDLLPELEGERPVEAELVAAELRAALDALGAIAGAISPDDVLGRVFAEFCIGK